MMKKIMMICCFAMIIMTIQGKCTLADELREDEKKVFDSVNSESNAEEPEQSDMISAADEEIVGVGPVTVGDGVTATLNKKTGAVEFYSDGGTLWRDWIYKSGFDKKYIKSIKVSSGTVYLPKDSTSIFNITFIEDRVSSNFKKIDLSGFDTSNVVNMTTMFYECISLKTVDLSGLDTSNVQSMREMFYGCKNLTTVNLSGLNTTNVKSMGEMFGECWNLTSLDLSSFETPNLTSLGGLFFQCWNLKAVDLSNFDTSNVTSFSLMFGECGKLTNLDLSNFETSSAKSMDLMFQGCMRLTTLDLSHFETSNVEHMEEMFNGCSNLKSLDLSGFDTSKAETSGMLGGCSALDILKTPRENKKSVKLATTMYDDAGTEYLELPVLSESIVLTRNQPETKTDICNCVITLSDTNYVYDGKAKEPFVTVKEADMLLTAGTDYTVSYADNTNTGTAVAKVQGIGNYKGEQSATFTIQKALPELTFASSNLNKLTSDAAFTNILTKTTDGTVTFISSDTNVVTVNSTSGLVTIKGAGTVTIIAIASEGMNYEGGSAVYTLKIEAPTPHVKGFSDVQDLSHPYYNAIYWAAEAGITKGYSDGTFGINKPCTRGEMLMFLWRFAGKPLPKAVWTSPFKDVPMGHTFFKAILWGYQAGITKGYSDGTFGINRNVSRGECMMFLWRVKGKPAPKTASKSPFMDVPMNHAFYKAILWGSQKGITKGYMSGPKKGNFGINDNCTRGQIVTFLYRAKS